MKFTTLDKIVRGVLLQKRWPIHYYVECLVNAQRCFEELGFDSLKNVRTVLLPINAWGAIPLPCDYIDWTKVGLQVGDKVMPLTQNNKIDRLNNFDASTGNKIPYPNTVNADGTGVNGIYNFGYGRNMVWFNDNMEYTGRFYGSAGDQTASFKVLVERREIQLDSNINATAVVLEYISDGSESDNATQITPYAKAAIEAWIGWKYKENGRSYSDGERERSRQLFNSEHKKLRARLSGLTVNDIKQSLRRNTHGSIKG